MAVSLAMDITIGCVGVSGSLDAYHRYVFPRGGGAPEDESFQKSDEIVSRAAKDGKDSSGACAEGKLKLD